MITILEGPDAAGKTTLAKRLEDLGYDNIHFGPPPKTAPGETHPAFYQYMSFLANAWPYDNIRSRVLDRFCYGEAVYGPVFRNDRSFEPWMMRLLERVMLSMQGLLVMCLPDWDSVEKVWRER